MREVEYGMSAGTEEEVEWKSLGGSTVASILYVGIISGGYIWGRPLPLIPKYITQAQRVSYVP